MDGGLRPPRAGVDLPHIITNVRIVVYHSVCKISFAVETSLMAMKMPDPRQEPQAVTSAVRIDWSSALAEHQRWLRTVICARVGEPQAIDEVMQEVSLAAVRQHAPLTDNAKVGAWLYRLAVRQSLLYRRKQGRRRKLIDRYVQRRQTGEFDSCQTDPLGWLLAKERQTQVRAALAHLPKRDAEILMLKYTEDWSYRQLAEHLGATESAIETRLHRARQRLRTELAAMNVTPADA
jgi:RNA polymerase sigma factor (sigma-70 family)